MTSKLLTEEEVQWALASLPEVDRAAVDAHLDALADKLRESEAGAAALRRAHGEPECWKYGHPSEDCTHYSSCSELRSALSSTAGRDLLERLRKAEAREKELEEKVESRQRQVDRLNAKLDDTHTHRCFKCESTVTEETSARQRLEAQANGKEGQLRMLRMRLEPEQYGKFLDAMKEYVQRSPSYEFKPPDPVRAALEKCAWGVERSIEVLHQHDTLHPDCGVAHPVTIDNLREALRAARDAGVGT